MDLNKLATEIDEIRRRIEATVKGVALDEYQQNAFKFISERLDEMETECRSGNLKSSDLRYPELGRIAVETDPAILPPELGGEMIEVEKKYQSA